VNNFLRSLYNPASCMTEIGDSRDKTSEHEAVYSLTGGTETLNDHLHPALSLRAPLSKGLFHINFAD
jgi:hypothetical protein